MKNGFRQSMAWLHTWTGLILGWLLFAIFATGTSAYFKEEISRWMTPELQIQPVSNEQAVMIALNSMQKLAPDAKNWYINLPDERQPEIIAYWSSASGYNNAHINPNTGEKISARDTQGGEFFYNFHFQLFGIPILFGRIIVGIAAMLMFVALVSGIITHKKIIRDFFTFRPKRGQRSWLDFHNVTSVMALPFFLMITYTGLAIFFYIYMPWGMTALYGKEQGKFFDDMNQSAVMSEATKKPAQMLSFERLRQQAEIALDHDDIATIEVAAPNDAQAVITFTPVNHHMLNIRIPGVQINAITGQVLAVPQSQSAMQVAAGAVYGLHMAHIANWPMRWLLFFSGILGCCMIGSGLVLWTVKRRLQQQKAGKMHIGYYLVERFNVAAIIGLPAAMASYFIANRLIEVQYAERSILEIKVFFAVWGLMLLHALMRPWRNAWKEQLFIAGALFFMVPVINILTTHAAGLMSSLSNKHWIMAGFDLTMLGFATAFWSMLFYLVKHQKSLVTKMQQKIERRALSKQQVAAFKNAKEELTH